MTFMIFHYAIILKILKSYSKFYIYAGVVTLINIIEKSFFHFISKVADLQFSQIGNVLLLETNFIMSCIGSQIISERNLMFTSLLSASREDNSLQYILLQHYHCSLSV